MSSSQSPRQLRKAIEDALGSSSARSASVTGAESQLRRHLLKQLPHSALYNAGPITGLRASPVPSAVQVEAALAQWRDQLSSILWPLRYSTMSSYKRFQERLWSGNSNFT